MIMSNISTLPTSTRHSTFKYLAFISYSHSDRRWAEWVHRSVERYKIPRELVGTAGRDGPIPSALFPLFRDRDELPSSPDLNKELLQALADSANLIVLCSPSAAQSLWVDQEILEFKRLGRSDRVHCIIVESTIDGRPAPFFAPSLLHPLGADGNLDYSNKTQPLAADIRAESDGKNGAKLKIVAGLLGIPLNALVQREIVAARRRRRVRLAVSGTIVVLAGFGALAAWLASEYRQTAANRLIPGVRIEKRETVVDLSGWQETTETDISSLLKKSLAVSSNKFTIVRTHEYATEFIHIVGTTSGIHPEVNCKGCGVRPRNAGATARAPNEWDVVFDISSIPIEQEIELNLQVKFWNAFQNPSQWWGGFRILHSTEVATYSIVFPQTKHPRPETIELYYFDTKPHTFTKEQNSTSDQDATGRLQKLTWTVTNPIADRSYRVKWVWD
jgi:hypothetical protein